MSRASRPLDQAWTHSPAATNMSSRAATASPFSSAGAVKSNCAIVTNVRAFFAAWGKSGRAEASLGRRKLFIEVEKRKSVARR
jgi:hypothetical protein